MGKLQGIEIVKTMPQVPTNLFSSNSDLRSPSNYKKKSFLQQQTKHDAYHLTLLDGLSFVGHMKQVKGIPKCDQISLIWF